MDPSIILLRQREVQEAGIDRAADRGEGLHCEQTTSSILEVRDRAESAKTCGQDSEIFYGKSMSIVLSASA
jgi:hypothetical protein